MLNSKQPLLVIRAATGGVGFPMGFKTGNGSITFTARVTNIGFLSMVYMGVKFHMNPLGVITGTGGATVGFFPGV